MPSSRYIKLSEDDFTEIKINVGGTVFTTTLETLTRLVDGSCHYNGYGGNLHLLSQLFRDTTELPEMIFIDRSPRLFELVLDFLRTPETTRLMYYLTRINTV